MRKILERLKASRYMKDVAWLSSGNLVGQVVSVASMPILSRLYDPHSFGLASLFATILNFAVVLCGFRYEMMHQLAKSKKVAQALTAFVLKIGLVWILLTSIVIVFAGASIGEALGSPEIVPWLWLIPFSAYATTLATALQNLLQREGAFDATGISVVIGKVSSTATQLSGFWLLPPPGGLIVASLTGALGQVAALTKRVEWRPLLASGKDAFRTAREFKGYSKSFITSHLLLSLTTGLPNVFIAKHYGNESLGHYSVALQLVFLPSALLGSSVGSVFFHRANDDFRNGRSLVGLFRKTVASTFLMGLPLYGGIALASTWALPFFLGAKWVQAGSIATLLTIPAFFSFVTGTVSSTCLIAGATWYAPGWHASRVLAIGALVLIARNFDLSFLGFLWAFVLQASLLYLLDLAFEWRFAEKASEMSLRAHAAAAPAAS